MSLIDFNNQNVISIAHRGYSSISPENTLISYINAKKHGFNFVECDISFTKDHIPVLLHDSTIDRTSNGKGDIEELYFNDVRKYDFGSWKDLKYKGEKIPTFEEFIILCKNLGLYPYIELKPTDKVDQIKENAKLVTDIVKRHGMLNKVSFISFSIDYLEAVHLYAPSLRLGLISYKVDFSNEEMKRFLSLRDNNKIFIDYYSKAITNYEVENCMKLDLPLEVWVVDTIEDLKNLDTYVSGITSNTLICGKELIELGIKR